MTNQEKYIQKQHLLVNICSHSATWETPDMYYLKRINQTPD